MIAAVDDALHLRLPHRRTGNGEGVADDGFGQVSIKVDNQQRLFVGCQAELVLLQHLFARVGDGVGHQPDAFLRQLNGEGKLAVLGNLRFIIDRFAAGQAHQAENDILPARARAGDGEFAGVCFRRRYFVKRDALHGTGRTREDFVELQRVQNGLQGVVVRLLRAATVDLALQIDGVAVADGLAPITRVGHAVMAARVLQHEEAGVVLAVLPLRGGVVVAQIAVIAVFVRRMPQTVGGALVAGDFVHIPVLHGEIILHGGQLDAHVARCVPRLKAHAARRPIRLRRLDGQSLLRQQILVVSKVRCCEHRVAVGDGQRRGKIIVGKISRQRGDCHQQRQQEREEQHRKQFPHQKSPAFVGNTRSGSLYHTFQAHTRHIL